MKNNYLLETADLFSLQQKIEEIIKENNFNDAAISNYDMSEVLLKDALEDLDTYGFLTSKKVIIISSIDSLNQDENRDDIKHLYQYLDNYNQDNLLIICSKKLNNTLKITKELKKKMVYIKVSLNAIDFVKEQLKDYKLESGVVNYLVEYCKEDITRLSNECSKLKLYKYDDKTISKKDIDEMVVEKLGDATELTFSFSRSLAQKDKKAALEKYQELLEYNVEPLAIIGLLASQIRIMYQVKILEKQRLSNDEIAKILQEKSSYRIIKTKELTKYYTERELLQLMIKLGDMDLKIKTSDVDSNFLIQLFILNI